MTHVTKTAICPGCKIRWVKTLMVKKGNVYYCHECAPNASVTSGTMRKEKMRDD